MSGVVRRAWLAVQGAITLFLALMLGCNLYLIFMEHVVGKASPTIFGYSAAVVASGSMEPALCVDDLILNRAQTSYVQGDIITFRSGTSLTTHRIVEVTQEGYVTKGDANNAADPEPVPADAVVGRVVGRVPRVGAAIVFLKTPLGMTALVFAGFLIIELPFLVRLREEHRSEEEEK